MHNREKYPEIWLAKERAENELKSLMDKRKIHTDGIAEVQLKINSLKQRKENLNNLAMQDAQRMSELRDEISRMAKAMGAIVAGKK